MENKDVKEMLKDLKELIEIFEDSDFEKAKEKFEKQLKEALNEPCKITIEKGKKGDAKLGIEGRRLALLISLAGAEESILKQLKCSEDEFKFIKNLVGTRDNNDDVEVL